MTEVTWGELAKAVGDTTKISDEIAAKILEHNQDESAHSQELESLFNHRVADILDHADGSITKDKYAPSSIDDYKRRLTGDSIEWYWPNVDLWSSDGDTGGYITRLIELIAMYTPAITGKVWRLHTNNLGLSFGWDADKLTAHFLVRVSSQANSEFIVSLGNYSSDQHIAFRFNNLNLYAEWTLGGSSHSVLVSTGYIPYESVFSFEFSAGEYIKFYLNYELMYTATENLSGDGPDNDKIYYRIKALNDVSRFVYIKKFIIFKPES